MPRTASVDCIMTARSCCQADPTFSCSMGRTVCQKQGSDWLPGEDAGQWFWLGPRCDNHVATGLRNESRRGELALHAAGAQRAAAGTREGEHLLVNLRHEAQVSGSADGVGVVRYKPSTTLKMTRSGAGASWVTWPPAGHCRRT